MVSSWVKAPLVASLPPRGHPRQPANETGVSDVKYDGTGEMYMTSVQYDGTGEINAVSVQYDRTGEIYGT